MKDIASAVRELIKHHITSIQHVEVLTRLRETEKPMTVPELQAVSRLSAKTVNNCLTDLMAAKLVSQDRRSTGITTYIYSALGEDRTAVDALAVLYHQFPDTLANIVFAGQPRAIKLFSDAFRLRDDEEET